MLTRKQKDLLVLIRNHLDKDGVPPSFDEMKEALGLRSKSGIHRLITGLEERGFIKRLPHRARALEILKLPDGLDTGKKASSRAVPAETPSAAVIAASSLSLPLYGRIAAGTPIEALRDPSTQIDVPAGLLASRRGVGDASEHYALEVAGDSMIEAGIMDGDHVVIRKCDMAENGAIVVALVDESEATLKYIERRAGKIALIPANSRYETRLLPADNVRVQGKLVGLVRKY
ncbi:MAG: transcriptional repressor LexA [Alphaproteobacteria bacterium]|nr:transcriptional repressor LexA [Alphaproteobacteria bacterium]